MHTKFPSGTAPVTPGAPPSTPPPASGTPPPSTVGSTTASTAAAAVDGVDAPKAKAKLTGAAAATVKTAPTAIPGIPESFPVDALSKIDGKGVSGSTFLLDGGSLRDLKLQIRRVVDGDAPGFEIMFQVTDDKLPGLLERMQTKGAKPGPVTFRATETQADGIAKFTATTGTVSSGGSHSPPDLDSNAGTWALAVDDPKGAKVEVVHGKAALAIRGLTRIQLRGDDAKCTEQLQNALKTLGLAHLFAPPTAKSKELLTLMRALWQADHNAARTLSAGDLDKLKPADVRAALESAGYDPARIDALRYEEVFPGHFTVVDPHQAETMAAAGARYMYSTVTDPAHVHSILEGGQKSSVQRYKDGLIINGMSTNADFVTGGATGVFTRMVTQNAIYSEHGWAGRTYKLIQNHSQLARTDWYGWDGDFYGRRWNLDTPTNFGVELVKRIDTGGGYKAYNELIFTAGNRPSNIDRVVATSDADRQKLITHLKEKGYTPHNGLSLEEFVVLSPKLMVFGPSPYKDIADLAAFATEALEKAGKGDNAQLQWFLFEGPKGQPRADLEQKILLDGPADALATLLKAARMTGTFSMSSAELDGILGKLSGGTAAQKAIPDRLVNEAGEALFRSGSDQAFALLDGKKPSSVSSYSPPFGITDEAYVRIFNDLASRQKPGAPRGKALQLALDLRAESLLNSGNAGFKAFLEKYPQVTPEDPKTWLAEKLTAVKSNGAGKSDVAMYLAQLTDKAKVGVAQRQLIEADAPSTLELLKGTLTTHGRLFIRGDSLAKVLGELPAGSQTRTYLLGSAPSALLKTADPKVFDLVKAHFKDGYNKEFGIYGAEWWNVVEAQLERTKGEVTDAVRQTMEVGGAHLVQQPKFKEKLATMAGLYEVADPKAFAAKALTELAAPGPGQLQLSWMILGPQAETLRAPAMAAILGSTDYSTQYLLGYMRDANGKLPGTPNELRALVAEFMTEPLQPQALNKLLSTAGKDVLLAADADTLAKLETHIGTGNVLSTLGLYGQTATTLLDELKGKGGNADLVRAFVLKHGAPLIASADEAFIGYLKTNELDYQALGKDAAWAAETVKAACDNVKTYWTTSYYTSYPQYSKLPDGAEYLLKGGKPNYDDAVLGEIEKSIKGWGWEQGMFDRFLAVSADLPEAWKTKLTDAYKGS